MWVLDRVQAFVAVLPDAQLGAGDGNAVGVRDDAMHPCRGRAASSAIGEPYSRSGVPWT